MSKKFVNSFANLVERIAREEFGYGRRMAGLEVPSTYGTTVKTIAQSCIDRSGIIYGMEALETLPKSGPESEDSGKVMQYTENLRIPKKIIDANEMRDVQVVVSPGLGGGKNLRGTFDEFNRLFEDQKCAIYLPINEGSDLRARYFNGMNYYINENSVNFVESDNFLRKVILPKMTDERTNELLPPEECDRFILANFSIGCRESYSHMRHFVNHLRAEGVEEKNVKKYLDRVLMINIGSPVNWNSGASEFPSSINIVSVEDMGSKKPEDFMSAIYCNPEMHSRDLTKLIKATYHDDCVEALYVMGPKVVSNGQERGQKGSFVGNPFGHGLPNYMDGIRAIPELRGMIEAYKSCLSKSTGDEEVERLTRGTVSQNAIRYLPASDFDPEGVKCLLETVHAFTGREDNAREAFKNKPNSNLKQPTGYSICEGQQVGSENFINKEDMQGLENAANKSWVQLTEESASNVVKGRRRS